jgi:hypothetical protein
LIYDSLLWHEARIAAVRTIKRYFFIALKSMFDGDKYTILREGAEGFSHF